MKTPNILSHDTMDSESITKANRDSLALINRHPGAMNTEIKKVCRPVCSKCHLAVPLLTWHQPPKIVPVGHGASMQDGHDAAQPINARHRMMGYGPAAFRPPTATKPPRHRACRAPLRRHHVAGHIGLERIERGQSAGRFGRPCLSGLRWMQATYRAGPAPPGGRRQSARWCSWSTTIATTGNECAIPTLRLTRPTGRFVRIRLGFLRHPNQLAYVTRGMR